MSATLTASPPHDVSHSTAPQPSAGRRTLEQTLERAWRDALTSGAAECPLCRARMDLVGGEVECAGCGSRLS
jgi:hypothetical protein